MNLTRTTARASLALVILAGTGCAANRERALSDRDEITTPRQAVMLAADHPDTGFRGRFRMTVLNTGADNDYVFLNSENDYRDPRNLTLRVPRQRADAVAKHLGVDHLEQLQGHVLEFEGLAQRTRVDFTIGNQPTGKYYYQTQATLDAAEHISDRGAP